MAIIATEFIPLLPLSFDGYVGKQPSKSWKEYCVLVERTPDASVLAERVDRRDAIEIMLNGVEQDSINQSMNPYNPFCLTRY